MNNKHELCSSHEKLGNRITDTTDGPESMILLTVWIVCIFGLPLTAYLENVIAGVNVGFRFGWLHMIAPGIACIVPAFFDVSWSFRVVLMLLTPFTCVIVMLICVIIDMVLFSGLNGVH